MKSSARMSFTVEGKLRHFSRAKEKDASGFSYCAVANLFGGNSGPANDIFLEIRE